MDRYETYTLEGTSTDNLGLGGWRVQTDRPVTVVAGAPCVKECTGSGKCYGGQAWSSVLENSDLGKEFVAFPVVDMLFSQSDKNKMTSMLYVSAQDAKTDVSVPGIDNKDRLDNPGDIGLV